MTQLEKLYAAYERAEDDGDYERAREIAREIIDIQNDPRGSA